MRQGDPYLRRSVEKTTGWSRLSGHHSAMPDGVSLGQLAHELNSLLDGSLRYLRMAQQVIDEAGDALPTSIDDASRKLLTAQDGLRQMARLLDRAMSAPAPDSRLFREEVPLELQVRRAMNALGPLAQEHRIEIHVDMTPKAAALPASTLGPLILNGLRNAIEACSRSTQMHRLVELSLAVNLTGNLMMLITDNGPGLGPEGEPALGRPNGHGIGLDLCRQIVDRLGGQLRLVNIPYGCGAVLQVTVPVSRLCSHD